MGAASHAAYPPRALSTVHIPDELLSGLRDTGLSTALPRADILPEEPRLLM